MTPGACRCRRRRLAPALLAAVALAGCAAVPSGAPEATATAGAAAASAPAAAAPDDATLQAFARWVAQCREQARGAGIDEATLSIAFDDVRYLARVVERDDNQPEFVRTVWDYLDRALSAERLATGQQKLAQVRAEADAAAARYGVPPQVLVAIWGLESNYGGNVGSIPSIDALATLGFQGRREAWARRQLLAALQILRSGDIDRAGMVGSWAGAMGQTQFLPTSFLAYAVDGDGDGRRDLWANWDDAIASVANYLASHGWRAGEPVLAPADLPDPDEARGLIAGSIVADSTVGSLRSRGLVFYTTLCGDAPALFIEVAGDHGPERLAGFHNFSVITRYNRSILYALAVDALGAAVEARLPRASAL